MSEIYQKQGLHQKALNTCNKAVEILGALEEKRPSYFQKDKRNILQLAGAVPPVRRRHRHRRVRFDVSGLYAALSLGFQ